MDWAISRNDSVREIEQLGNEIERMDREMEKLHTDIQALHQGRFNINSFVPMQSIKTTIR